MTSPDHAKRCLADFIREMSGTYADKDISPLASLARNLKRRSGTEVHGYFLEDGNTVVFTGTDGRVAYELRISDQSAAPIRRPEPDVFERRDNVVAFPTRKPPAAIPLAIPDAVLDDLEAVLQREIENRRNPDVEN
jgi:hypothetical protein